jgi:predicted MFS family arabinose efflux permease
MTVPPSTLQYRDRSYGCFAFLGLATLAILAAPFVSKESSQGYATTVGLGLPLPMLLAFIVGLYLAARSQWHWPLVVLCLITVLFWTFTITTVLTESDSESVSQKHMETEDKEACIYAAVSILLAAWWFAIGCWRYKAMLNSEPT